MNRSFFLAVPGVMFLLMILPGFVFSQGQQDMAKEKEFRIERSISEAGIACIQCHKQEHPGIFADWANSRHANANITCIDCHKAEETDPDVTREHYKQYEQSDSQWGRKQYRVPVAGVVTPKDCSRCHPDEADQYKRSKHANTLEIIWKIDPWLNKGMNSDFERASGCFYCHGTVLDTDENGNLTPETWPNVGVGRMNLDGSKGSCSSCHTRHRFALMEARKPQACGQCHLGPDHPQIEIYTESKHGAIYDSFGDEYNWTSAPGTWSPGVDFRAPTCAACHMSGAGTTRTTHDVTERLSWEIQAPLTVRPSDFKPFPAKTNWEVERKKMKEICLQCHGDNWVDDHYATFDKVVEEYNEVYFKPAMDLMNELYEKGLVDDEKMFDEKIEVEYYELWHHEGRRARMGAAMMAPDYTWWHGFYEVKHRYNSFMKEGRELIEHNKKAEKAPDFPNATGRTIKPEAVFGSQ
jgi:hydroxylamine dehydrogenase